MSTYFLISAAAEVEFGLLDLLAETSDIRRNSRLEIEMTFQDELSGAKCDWYFRYDR